MLKLTVHDVERDRTEVRFGAEDALLKWLRSFYPATLGATSLSRAVMALDATDLYQVKVEPWDEPPRWLPDDLKPVLQSETDDPWPRRA